MKKFIKRLSILFVALGMLLYTGIPTLAEENETATIIIQNSMLLSDDERTYEGYLIFNATSSPKECNLKHVHTDDCRYNYAYTVNEKYRDELKKVVCSHKPTLEGDSTCETNLSDNEIIEYVEGLKPGEGTGSVQEFARELYSMINNKAPDETNNNGVFNNVSQGYWLIVDITEFDDPHNANSLIIVDTKGQDELIIKPKTSVPTVTKKIVTDSGEVDYTDVSIGDDVTFRLTGTVAEHIDAYGEYRYFFHDKLSDGLDKPEENAFTVTADGKNVRTGYEIIFENLGDDCTFHVAFEDLKQLTDTNGNPISVNKDSKIIVEYKTTLNSNAVIGNGGSSSPFGNENRVFLEFSNNPQGDGTGKTPDDIVHVFTFQINGTKVEDSETEGKKKLSDAWFVLYKKEADGNKYVILDEEGKVSNWNANKPTHTNSEAGTGSDASEQIEGNISSNADGEFKIIGLDAGTYYLEETVAPKGYNKLEEPIEIVIAPTYDVNGTLMEDEKISALTGTVEIMIANRAGVLLPSTGGSGTTMFYLIGGGLVAVAAVLLIVRRSRD